MSSSNKKVFVKKQSNNVKDWASVIEESAKLSTERQDKRVADLEKTFKMAKLSSFKDKDLVDYLTQYAGFSALDKRENELYQNFVKRLKKEVLRRMPSKK